MPYRMILSSRRGTVANREEAKVKLRHLLARKHNCRLASRHRAKALASPACASHLSIRAQGH